MHITKYPQVFAVIVLKTTGKNAVFIHRQIFLSEWVLTLLQHLITYICSISDSL